MLVAPVSQRILEVSPNGKLPLDFVEHIQKLGFTAQDGNVFY
jgi:hypothetical protein